jgi:hypothetical protein
MTMAAIDREVIILFIRECDGEIYRDKEPQTKV